MKAWKFPSNGFTQGPNLLDFDELIQAQIFCSVEAKAADVRLLRQDSILTNVLQDEWQSTH